MFLYSVMLLFLQEVGSWEQTGLLMVVAEETPLQTITRWQLQRVYLKRMDRVGGVPLTPIHLKKKDALRKSFEAALFRKSFDLESYWLEQKLQGGARPPLVVSSEAFVLVYVERNPGFIGYVSVSSREALANFGVKVLTVVEGPR